MDQITLREFDPSCQPPVKPLRPEQIQHIRETTRARLAVFASLSNAGLSTVQR